MAMKKTVLANACLLALAAGATSALANVQIGGVVIGNQDQTLSNVDIVTSGSTRGVEIYNPAQSGFGSITLSNSNIRSENGDGIYMLSGSTSLDGVNIDTQGGKGIDVNNYSSADLLNTHITTQGSNADGLWLAMDQSTASLNKSSIATSGSASHALNAQYGTATLNYSQLSTAGQGSYGLYTENSVTGSGNTISTTGDSGFGVFAARGGHITLSKTDVSTAGKGAAGLLAYVDSSIDGDTLNVQATGANSPTAWVSEGTLNLKNSTLAASGQQGAGVLISTSAPTSSKVSQVMLDNTQLTSSNGAALQINSNALADIQANNGTVLTGDVRALTGSRASLAFNHNSSLEGAVDGLNQLNLDSSSRWLLTGHSQLNALNNNGEISFQNGAFKTLEVNTLSGSGAFAMNGDLAALRSDHLTVNGEASGAHLLRYSNSGANPTDPHGVLPLVSTGTGSSAQFQLANGKVDAGAFSYQLEQRGDQWVLAAQQVGGGENPGAGGDTPGSGSGGGFLPSPGAASALGIANALPTVWYAELSTLRSRMGELRSGNREGGVWAQTLGGETRVDNGAGVAYRQQQSGVSIGVDSAHPLESSRVITGLFSGVSNNDLHFTNGSSGRVNSFFVGSYASWLADNGWFSDAVIKFNNYQSSADARLSDGSRIHGGYSVPGIGLSLEGGKHIELSQGWFIEPSAQIAALWTKGDRYHFDNGLQAESGTGRSQQAALHGMLGKDLMLENGMLLQPWLRLSAIQELENRNNTQINGYRFNNDLSGTRGQLTAGVAAQLRQDTQIYAEASTAKGRHIEQPWHAALGVRWSW
ncbi:autotransporter outer membrane beta-barrel domain-containing protein [Pantoea sp. Taur]|uniref:autotransporter outer membrane beta-barrel domain-containing protein n=1 Tax=Pantoea sp. Taur TaxID=2576757 RepID=UPI001352E8A1|nr:autotransporter outer membrane beta-barrel domain-containing protein [Pantoea sp. Taur]MXP57133.1 autotransporter outer membrane beta-barrel domain-containing protein [Pantoea sp. Taur]